jgi:hypothetical protein
MLSPWLHVVLFVATWVAAWCLCWHARRRSCEVMGGGVTEGKCAWSFWLCVVVATGVALWLWLWLWLYVACLHELIWGAVVQVVGPVMMARRCNTALLPPCAQVMQLTNSMWLMSLCGASLVAVCRCCGGSSQGTRRARASRRQGTPSSDRGNRQCTACTWRATAGAACRNSSEHGQGSQEQLGCSSSATHC